MSVAVPVCSEVVLDGCDGLTTGRTEPRGFAGVGDVEVEAFEVEFVGTWQ